MDEYSLLTTEKERSFGKDLENSTCSTNQTWEELSLISEDEGFSLVSSDNEDLSPGELMDEKDPAEHNDGPGCSFVADESQNDNTARPSDLRAMREPTDHPTTATLLECEETSSSDNGIRVCGPSDKEIGVKEERQRYVLRNGSLGVLRTLIASLFNEMFRVLGLDFNRDYNLLGASPGLKQFPRSHYDLLL